MWAQGRASGTGRFLPPDVRASAIYPATTQQQILAIPMPAH